MSRARSVILPEELVPLIEDDHAFDGQHYWFEVHRNSDAASDKQLELLAIVEDADLDDLLDSVLTQGEVLTRLRTALGQGAVIPAEVLRRRQEWRNQRHLQPECVKCGREGDSTKHHFVNKWILRELDGYTQKWADRSKNCIPLCIHCHRLLHADREDLIDDKSIVEYLSDTQRDFAEAALTALSEQRPKLLLLIARGNPGVYETRLVRDWIEGKFAEPQSALCAPSLRASHLRAVV